jgi:hypothetical protein
MDLEEVADRLIECEQRLASLPETNLRLERALAENAALQAELESTRTTLHEVIESTSWRLTEPLRKLQHLGGRR